jgi:lincosamide nucleotidyltransferase
MLVQERLIVRVRELCEADQRLDGALMYGSFAAGDGDAYSDIEFWLFFAPRWHPGIDPREWCAQVAPFTHLVRNEFGTDVVFFAGLVRGEFHFASTGDIPGVREWPARSAPVDRMLVVDRTGELRPALESLPDRPPVPGDGAAVDVLCGRFANWLVLAHQLACRGEALRAWDALGHVQRHLVWLARLATGETRHWLTPTRGAESELPPRVLAELRQATAAAELDEIHVALHAAWRTGRGYWTELTQRYGRPIPADLFAEIDDAL